MIIIIRLSLTEVKGIFLDLLLLLITHTNTQNTSHINCLIWGKKCYHGALGSWKWSHEKSISWAVSQRWDCRAQSNRGSSLFWRGTPQKVVLGLGSPLQGPACRPLPLLKAVNGPYYLTSTQNGWGRLFAVLRFSATSLLRLASPSYPSYPNLGKRFLL